jgi:hemerythrin
MIEASVLVPVYRGTQGELRLILIRRSDNGTHGGHLAFPGGKRDPGDRSMLDTALREAREEVGIPESQIQILAELPPAETRTTGFRVHSFLGRIIQPVAWQRNEHEIADGSAAGARTRSSNCRMLHPRLRTMETPPMQEKNWTVTWDDTMSVGIAEIDADHKQFLAFVDDFNRSVEVRMSAADIEKRLQALLDDATAHFANEERLLHQWGYPGADDHARMHAELLDTLDYIRAQISLGHDAEWVQAGLSVKQALISHVLNEDQKFAGFFRGLRGAPAAGKGGG